MIETLNRTRHMIMNYTLPGADKSITSGIKIHTLRTDRVGRWKPGYAIHHYKGTRFDPDYRLIQKDKVKHVQQVLLVLLTEGNKRVVKVNVDRRRLTDAEVEQFAINDGFQDVNQMMDWFFKDKITMWGGKLISWTNHKY